MTGQVLGEKKCCNPINVHFEYKGPKLARYFYIFWLTSTTALLKENLLELQGWLSPFWKLEMSMMYVCLFYFSWHTVIVKSLKSEWRLNFNCVLLIIQLAEDIEILLSWTWEIPLSIQITFLLGKNISQHPETRLTILLY